MAKTPITIVGTAGGNPELSFTKNGVAVCNLSVAVNERIYDKQTEEFKDGTPSWYRISLWREAAENVAESIQRGTRVIVTGNLVIEEFTRKDGTKGNNATIKDAVVGPDLTYATATVTKNAPRQDNNGGGYGNGGGNNSGGYNNNGGGNNGGYGGQQQAQGGWGGGGQSYDEPPF